MSQDKPPAPATLAIDGSCESLLTGPARDQLEKSLLPQFMANQRWFGAKARRIDGMRIVDWVRLEGPTAIFVTFVEVQFTGAGADLYCVPLSLAAGDAAQTLLRDSPASVLTRFESPDGESVVYDSLVNEAFCQALLEAIENGREFKCSRGTIRGFATAAFPELRGPDASVLKVRRGPGGTANSGVIYGSRLILKLFRRLEPGRNPDFELGRFLTEKTSFRRVPMTAGAIEYILPGAEPTSLALLQGLVNNEGNGWEHALAEVGRYFERVSSKGPASSQIEADSRTFFECALDAPPQFVVDALGGYLRAAGVLGQRTAELHRALCEDQADPAFAPEPITAVDLGKLSAGWKKQAAKSLAALQANIGSIPVTLREPANRLLQQQAQVVERVAGLPSAQFDVAKIRCHGDYHLGQVLRADDDFVILDFEGEPARSLAERRAKESPLRDVAGMLRSFDYAAWSGLFSFTADQPEQLAVLEPWAALWQKWAAAAFLKDYAATAAGCEFFPSSLSQARPWLERFILEKAFYELDYELNNRPTWVGIPLLGILSLLRE